MQKNCVCISKISIAIIYLYILHAFMCHTHIYYRTEVFDKYYFPAKWEANEMEALINFLKLEDPFSKAKSGGGIRGGSMRQNNDLSNSFTGKSSRGGGGRRGNRRATTATSIGGTSGSWQSGEANSPGSTGGLGASITSSFKLGLGDSAGKLTKLLVSKFI